MGLSAGVGDEGMVYGPGLRVESLACGLPGFCYWVRLCRLQPCIGNCERNMVKGALNMQATLDVNLRNLFPKVACIQVCASGLHWGYIGVIFGLY